MNSTTEKLEIRQLANQDVPAFKQLINVFSAAFGESEPAFSNERNLLKLLNKNEFIVIAAFSESEVVGGLTAYELPMYHSESSEIFLYDLAVKPEFQGIGIGKRLIHKLQDFCRKNGIKEFFVLAHEEDQHAVEFYRSTGGIGEKVINFLYEAADTKK